MMLRQVGDIEYQLMPGTDRATTDIVIERDGVVAVRPPKSFEPEQVDEVVRSKRLWIYRNLAEWRDLNSAAVVREWVNGESFLYLGKSYRLRLVDDSGALIKLQGGCFKLNRKLIENNGSAAARKALTDFYIEKGQKKISQRVEFFVEKIGVRPSGLVVKDLGYRWASCGQKCALSFHWKCMMAPTRVIDYIIVHELCHIHFKDHSDSFWNEVDKVMPDYRERKVWLAKNGASLDL